jgi:hypothetical protein
LQIDYSLCYLSNVNVRNINYGQIQVANNK